MKKIAIVIIVTFSIFLILAADGLMDLIHPSKITISKNYSSKNFENYWEIKQTLADLYNSDNPEQWSKDHPDQFYPVLEFLNDYTVWELQQPTSTAKKFFQQLATENQRQIVCLE